MDDSAIRPTVINLGSGPSQSPKPARGLKIFFLLGGFLILVVGLAIGIFLVQKQQDVRSKATGCDMRFPADPNTTCGKTTQLPAQNTTNISLTPNFHWDYGGYRSEDNDQCVTPSGCGQYQTTVFLAKVTVGANPFHENYEAVCSLGPSPTPIKDAPLNCFKVWDKVNQTVTANSLVSLEPDTDYYWLPFTSFGGCPTCFHTGWSWIYHFKTGAPTSTTPDCTSLTTTADLNNLQVGTEYSFQLTAGDTAPITSVEMSVHGDSCSNDLRAYAPQTVSGPGTYTIKWTPTQTGSFTAYGRVWNDSVAECRSDCIDGPPRYLCAGAQACKLTGTVKNAPTHKECVSNTCTVVTGAGTDSCPNNCAPSTAACQMVSSDPADLSKAKINDTITFTGRGVTSSDTEIIDKINFIISKDGTEVSNTEDTATKDGATWKGTKTFKVTGSGSYSVRIRVHWKNQDVWKE